MKLLHEIVLASALQYRLESHKCRPNDTDVPSYQARAGKNLRFFKKLLGF